MKQKYTLNIADLQISVISDAPADEVEKVGMILDRKMREIYLKSRCPKTEAALLCALSLASCKATLKPGENGLYDSQNKITYSHASTVYEATALVKEYGKLNVKSPCCRRAYLRFYGRAFRQDRQAQDIYLRRIYRVGNIDYELRASPCRYSLLAFPDRVCQCRHRY